MSLGIVFKGSEGMVLAADSRVTLNVEVQNPGGANNFLMPATFDNATKLLKVTGQDHVAAVTYGLGTIGFPEPRTAHSLLPEFEAALGDARLSVKDFSIKLSDFFMAQWRAKMPPDANLGDMYFIVGGYNEDEPYGRIYEFRVPSSHTPVEQAANDFGVRWGGQHEIVSRIMIGYDPALSTLLQTKYSLSNDEARAVEKEINVASGARIPYQFLPLQDCVDLSIMLIRTTAKLMEYQTVLRGVGGAVDVATITRQEGFNYVQCKQISGERSDS